MRSGYPKLKNETLTKPVETLVFKVADRLRNSSGDKILNSSAVIKEFVKNYPNEKLMEVVQYLEDNKSDLSYKSELHPDRISWISGLIKENLVWSQMKHSLGVSRFNFGFSMKKGPL